jgi:hypothetical protein
MHGGISFLPYRQQFDAIMGEHIHYMETYNASEGFFGIQDELGSDEMLLMLDYGIYYEFIPAEYWHSEQPQAIGLADVEVGKNYAVVISTNGGLWRYMIGDTIRFTSTYPFRFQISGRTKQYINIAKDVSTNIHKLDLASTHEPPSVAAGCILLVISHYNIQISKKQVSDIFNISDVTISKTYRKISPYHKIILNNKITDLILEKKNAGSKNNSTLNQGNLIVNQESSETDSEKKEQLLNEDSDEDDYDDDEEEDEDESDDNMNINNNNEIDV